MTGWLRPRKQDANPRRLTKRYVELKMKLCKQLQDEIDVRINNCRRLKAKWKQKMLQPLFKKPDIDKDQIIAEHKGIFMFSFMLCVMNISMTSFRIVITNRDVSSYSLTTHKLNRIFFPVYHGLSFIW